MFMCMCMHMLIYEWMDGNVHVSPWKDWWVFMPTRVNAGEATKGPTAYAKRMYVYACPQL